MIKKAILERAESLAMACCFIGSLGMFGFFFSAAIAYVISCGGGWTEYFFWRGLYAGAIANVGMFLGVLLRPIYSGE